MSESWATEIGDSGGLLLYIFIVLAAIFFMARGFEGALMWTLIIFGAILFFAFLIGC